MDTIEGVDHEWFCVDKNSHVAVFTSAGCGPIPLAIREDVAFDKKLSSYLLVGRKDSFVTQLRSFSGSSRGRKYSIHSRDRCVKSETDQRMIRNMGVTEQAVEDSDLYQEVLKSFIEFSRVGVYAYDWVDVHRKVGEKSKAYELITSPADPILLDKLPNDYQATLERRRLPTSFAQERCLRIETY